MYPPAHLLPKKPTLSRNRLNLGAKTAARGEVSPMSSVPTENVIN